jgi:Cysteine-rich secretory protein family
MKRPNFVIVRLAWGAIMKLNIVRYGLALVFISVGVGLCHADCAALYALAQRHAYDMARPNSLDHAGFMRHRGPAGAVAENVGVGCETEECARRMWMQSPRHRANMMLGGCQAVASAVSASGRRYWVMEIGGGRGGGASRDFSVDGGNAQ